MRGRGYYSQVIVSRLPNLNPPIFLFTLVGANPPNLMPAKFPAIRYIERTVVGKYTKLLKMSYILYMSASYLNLKQPLTTRPLKKAGIL